MNLSTLSQLPAEPLHMLGKSRRQIAEEAAAEERKNAKPAGPPPMTSAPAGYEVTAQGGLRRKDQPWIVPETKGRAVKAEQINAQPAQRRLPRTLDELAETEWFDEEDTYSRLVELRGGCRCRDCPPCRACSDPITEQEAVQLGLIEPAQPAESGEVPSWDDLAKAMLRIGPSHWAATRAISGLENVGSVRDIPADRRAEVIAALNALGG